MNCTMTNQDMLINKIISNIQHEHTLFKSVMLSKSKQTIYDSCNIIRFYECIYEYFKYNEGIDENILCYFSEQKDILSSLYHFYMKHEECAVGTWEEIDEMLDMYIIYNS